MAAVFFQALLLLLFVIVAFVCTLVVVAALYIAHVHRKYAHLPGPPYHSFFLGHGPELYKFCKHGEFIQKLLLQWMEEYGPCFKLFVLHKCIVNVGSESLLKEFLTKTKYIKAHWSYTSLYSISGTRFLGSGLLTEVDHKKWHKRRVLMNPAFHNKYLRMSMRQFNAVADQLVETLSHVADGQTVFSMHNYLCHATMDVIAKVGFNYSVKALEDGDNSPFVIAILNCLKAVYKQLWFHISFEYSPGERTFRKTAQESVKFLRQCGQDIINRRMLMIACGDSVPEDILTHIVKCKQADPSLSDEDFLDDFITFFIAGHETTANALSFLLCEVGRRPEIMQRIQEEVDAVMGSKSFVEYEDLSKLRCCDKVFKETLRLYPPAPATARENVEEVTVDGFCIPAHSWIIFPFYAIHRLHSNFDNPEEFRIDRFSTDSFKNVYCYLPFSIGHRSCIGRQFAVMEAKVLLCKLFKNFNFELDMNQSFDILDTTTLRPKGGAIVTCTPRY